MDRIREKAYAKLNLSLDVLGRRPDGFHDMRMVMQSARLCDDVTVELTDGAMSAQTDKPYIPGDDRNVAVKAARAFFAAAGIAHRGALIVIQKRVPVCAGLGGGSSDAAAVLRALNVLTGAGFTGAELEKIAAGVGSDVAFCVQGGTQLAEGRGDALTPLPPLPETPAVICMPHFTASTPELFQRIDARSSRCHPDTEGLLAALRAGDAARVSRRMYNVFEDVLERRAAVVKEIKSVMLDEGAMGAAMSGTGSAVFGLFPDEERASAAVTALRVICREVFLTATCGQAKI